MRAFAIFAFAVLVTDLATAAEDPAYDTPMPFLEPMPDRDQADDVDLEACDSCSSSCSSVSCGTCCAPCWTITTDAVFLSRSPLDFAALANYFGGTQQGVRQFENQTGWQIDFIRAMSDERELEVRCLGIDGWSARGYFDVVPPTSSVARYASKLYSAEINVRWPRPSTPYITWLVGFRYVELNETFDYLQPAPFFRRDVDTRNNMYGFQLGALLDVYDHGGPLRIDTDFRIGVYSDRMNRVEFIPGTPPVLNASTFEGTAFLGEIDVLATWELTQRLALRVGYQMLWLDGVALASNNFLSGQNNSSGALFCHGATGGIECTW